MPELDKSPQLAPQVVPPTPPRVVVVHSPKPPSTLEDQAGATTLGDALLENESKTNIGVPTPEIDRVQEAVMTAISPDGRPSHRRFRLAEWKWFLIGALLLGVFGVAWAVLGGVTWPTLIMGAALVCLYLGAAVPAWGAGLLRGGEERQARKAALVQAQRNRPS